MKTMAITLAALIGLSTTACAQAQSKNITLNQPDMNRTVTMMKAFEQRQSTREFSEQEISLQDLSDLLWAAWGYNRPADKKRTAPTAQNKQEIDVYVLTKDGVYLYDAETTELKHIADGDVREAAATQAFAKKAPVQLVIVSNMDRWANANEHAFSMTAMDAGIVSQNISIFCAGAGLATVPRGGLDKDKLSEALKLNENQIIQLNHPVGYMK